MQALTATTRDEAARIYRMLLATDAGTGLMHESFHVDQPDRFTRAWFAWGNSVFVELSLKLAGSPVPRALPHLPVEVREAVRSEETGVVLGSS
jgi:meiotically up-regulated gene 157 (Mug157) protein